MMGLRWGKGSRGRGEGEGWGGGEMAAMWCGASWDDNGDECMICTILSDYFLFFFSLCMIHD